MKPLRYSPLRATAIEYLETVARVTTSDIDRLVDVLERVRNIALSEAREAIAEAGKEQGR